HAPKQVLRRTLAWVAERIVFATGDDAGEVLWRVALHGACGPQGVEQRALERHQVRYFDDLLLFDGLDRPEEALDPGAHGRRRHQDAGALADVEQPVEARSLGRCQLLQRGG